MSTKHAANTLRVAAALFAVFTFATVGAHDGKTHVSELGITDLNVEGSSADLPFPVDFDAHFNLIDHHGTPRTETDFSGQYVLVFFGYVNCQSMCSTALKRVSLALEELDATGKRVQPVMITVDPERDTLEVMREKLPAMHPRLLGLTGSAEALEVAYRSYHVSPPRYVGDDTDANAVFSHNSYLYLMSPSGDFLTLIPPILDPPKLAKVIAKYVASISI